MDRPRWSDLTPAQQARFGNGIGPSWFPRRLRRFITTELSGFFNEASWRHHDFGYFIGHRESHRAHYDWLFFRAMVRDSLAERAHLVPLALTLSLLFFAAVRLGGWPSFHYSRNYRSPHE